MGYDAARRDLLLALLATNQVPADPGFDLVDALLEADESYDYVSHLEVLFAPVWATPAGAMADLMRELDIVGTSLAREVEDHLWEQGLITHGREAALRQPLPTALLVARRQPGVTDAALIATFTAFWTHADYWRASADGAQVTTTVIDGVLWIAATRHTRLGMPIWCTLWIMPV